MTLPFEYVSRTAGELPRPYVGSAVIGAIGVPGLAGVAAELASFVEPQLIRPGTNVVVVPVGPEGMVHWTLASGMTLPVACLIAQVRTDAILFLKNPELKALLRGRSYWEELSKFPEDHITSLTAIELPQQVEPYLDLAPRSQNVDAGLSRQIDALGGTGTAGAALKAGLYQIFDDLDRSHESAQSIEGRGRHHTGDYWHAIMHRREPDYGNAKYWFRHVGRHPIFPPLAEFATGLIHKSSDADAVRWLHKLAANGWDAMAFVDLCQTSAREPESVLAHLAKRLQWMEMLLLLQHSCQEASSDRA
ncbi:hypothetical protein [Planctomicrobium piriforme]|uniref:Uncharacterized protein n=1 Tax=Planctomicrobium piriforme TaxID=1576369 RepID=A0A1I3SYI6_9PLAN|nr:hypothetical protein [Planctomicrobium piriforme]SFJ63908.1 hypothetical protein SAMN05421753_12639 [Planctomicrobium piriforme]